ncbi:hypothetical protein [Neorhizobium sp. AL 9.2.2]|uniref:hypothetical protein n=1 Tax=Neorhizobium sp. AL 9.2.2 TaxID=2712894 RepID=UPI00157170E3|nr:hypothetical protein [Neorhizobium sp. AL 9.2.2]NSY16161.1 hypothetical protein [Neorhizobium sp. AL 9.2.2]
MDMIEKVALAIIKAAPKTSFSKVEGTQIDYYINDEIAFSLDALEFAKAAIEAMRDPTEAMTRAADDCEVFGLPKTLRTHDKYTAIMNAMMRVAAEQRS